MVENEEKKYYWLKLKEDFFRDKRIKKLRHIAGGDTYTIIYLKLQLLSLKNNGMLIFEGVEPTLEEEMALEIDEDLENVKITIAFLQASGLLAEVEKDQYIMTETVKCIGSETKWAEKKRQYRIKQKENELLEKGQCPNDVLSMSDKREEIEKEIEIDKDVKKENILKERNDETIEVVNEVEQMFNEFWKVYPKKVDPKGSYRAFKNVKGIKKIFPKLMQALEIQKQSKQWQNKQFIPNPTTWLHQERWESEPNDIDYKKVVDNISTGGF